MTNGRRNSFRVAMKCAELSYPGLAKLNPGLELANAFSVKCRTPSGFLGGGANAFDFWCDLKTIETVR